MRRPGNYGRVRRGRAVIIIAVLAGFAVAATSSIAGGKSFTLKIVKNVHVDNSGPAKLGAPIVHKVNKHEAVVAGPLGFAVYTFKGETSKPRHIICKKTNNNNTNCWAFWPPVSVNSAKGLSMAPGLTGKLGTFVNHGVLQLTLNGRPLYYFEPDLASKNKTAASGDLLTKTFGSTWHIVTPK